MSACFVAFVAHSARGIIQSCVTALSTTNAPTAALHAPCGVWIEMAIARV